MTILLGITTLLITTDTPLAVPAVSPVGLAGMLSALAAAGLLALRRRVRV